MTRKDFNSENYDKLGEITKNGNFPRKEELSKLLLLIPKKEEKFEMAVGGNSFPQHSPKKSPKTYKKYDIL